jgi:hypothetical protein
MPYHAGSHLPAEALTRRSRMRVVIVVPPFPENEDGYQCVDSPTYLFPVS